MVVTIFPSHGSQTFIGPGIPLQISTSATGFDTSTANWGFNLYQGNIGGARTIQAQIGVRFTSSSFVLIPFTQSLAEMTPGFQIAPTDTQGSIDARLFDNSGSTIDTGQANGTWDAQTGVGVQIQTMTQQESAGLPEDQLALLQTSANNSVSILDGITTTVQQLGTTALQTLGQMFSWQDTATQHVTSFGDVSCDPIDVNLTGTAVYGVQVILTSIDPGYVFTGPAEDWCIKDLAVLSIERDSQQIYRHGVHTRFFEVYPLPGISYPPALILNQLPFVSSDYHVKLVFAAGVCGQLAGRLTP